MQYEPPLIRPGDRHPAVREVRSKLAVLGLVDGGDRPGDDLYDDALEQSVRHFQQSRGLSSDGVVTSTTYRLLDEARWRLGDRLLYPQPDRPMTGDDVLGLQSRLAELGFDVGRLDGEFGSQTVAALRDFQRNMGLPADGTCGPATFKSLDRLAPMVTGGQPDALRAREQLRRAGPHLSGKRVVIDPGHGGDDLGVVAHGLTEARITGDTAARIEGRLAATGVQVWQTHAPTLTGTLTDSQRAGLANATDADVVISLHVDRARSPRANGVATFYYGRDETTASAMGGHLASLIQREIVARTDLVDCRTHARTWDLLRRTRMTAVRVELGYLTNPHDAARLADPAFRDLVAEAIVVALQRLYLPAEADPETGTMRVTDIPMPSRSAVSQTG
jgi:N-acetylmuramoyl-L-alanine amidase